MIDQKYPTSLFFAFVIFQMLWFFSTGSYIPEKDNNKLIKCSEEALSSSSSPIKISMSPSFISNATSYLAPRVCPNDGICEKIPLICEGSSCCFLKYNTKNIVNISPPVPLSHPYSNWGFYDSKRKTCKPLKTFRLDYDTCEKYDDVQISSKFELAQAPTADFKCKDNSALVEVNVNNENVHIRIKSGFCLPKINHNGRLLLITSLVGNAEQVLTIKCLSCLKSNFLKEVKGSEFLQNEKPCAKTENIVKLSSSHDEFHGDKSVASNTASMSPGFIPFDGIQQILNSVIPENTQNSLLDDKSFSVGHTACTKNGEIVQRKLTVRIPSEETNNCKNGTWTSFPIKDVTFKNDGNGKLMIGTTIRQCVISGRLGKDFVEIEDSVKVEINIASIEKQMETVAEQFKVCKE